MHQTLCEDHEYAGFRYRIVAMPCEDGLWLEAYPHPGQHPAASKAKHRRAAVETYSS